MQPDLVADNAVSPVAGQPLNIAFVNNMPDTALAATWDQFSRLLHANAGEVPVRIRKYVFNGTPRREKARLYLAQSHEHIDALYARGADVLIVTGTEPRADNLRNEPYWPEFARLVDWASYNTVSALWSCLAAHAAVLHLDGIKRRPEQRKVSGVYSFATTGDPQFALNAGTVRVPHSRLNGLSQSDLEQQGYRVMSSSPNQGVDMFSRREPSLFVFTQGHMEYDAETLSREYRRDVLRYVSNENSIYPEMPEHYFSDETALRLDALREAIQASPADFNTDSLMEILSAETYAADWTAHAQRFYLGWLRHAAIAKAARFAETA